MCAEPLLAVVVLMECACERHLCVMVTSFICTQSVYALSTHTVRAKQSDCAWLSLSNSNSCAQ